MRSATSFECDSPLRSQCAKGTASASVAGEGSGDAKCFAVPLGTAAGAAHMKSLRGTISHYGD